MAQLTLRHCLRPAHPTTSAPPVLVLFHGNGGNAADFQAFWADLDPAWLLITPDAPYQVGPNQYTWLKDAADPQAEPVPMALQRLQTAVAMVRQFVQQALRVYAPDSRCVYLLGHSQGASAAGTLGLLASMPLAGVVMLSGYLWPPTLTLLTDTAHLSNRAFLVGHGLHDMDAPIALGRVTRDHLAGLPVQLTYREYAMGHGISAACRTDVITWLQQRRARTTLP